LKRQYLGDARDAFKWEYQDLLCRQLGYSELQIVPMLTPDDETNEGSLHSTKFAAASEIHDFCEMLRRSRSLDGLKLLPSMTGADYRVRLHKPETIFLDLERDAYFSNLHTEPDQLVFVDPDIGFEPQGRHEKHVAFADVKSLLDQATRSSAVSVYQHKRRTEPFQKTLEGIRRRLVNVNSAAIFNHNVMFITLSCSRFAIDRVAGINGAYAANRGLFTMGPGRMPGTIGKVLDALNRHKTRATYGAVAGYLGTQARSVSQLLGARRPEASWVVSKRNGLPTGYSRAQRHKDLQSNCRIIETTQELASLIDLS